MRKLILLSFFILCHQLSWCQQNEKVTVDTLKLSLSEIESIFLSQNLELLSKKYSIDSANATLITAGLYDNPELEYSHSFYNVNEKRFFEPQMTVQLSQLIQLGSKRKKSIALNQKGVEMASLQFSDLLRSLRFELRNRFFEIHFLMENIKLYELEIPAFERAVQATENQVKIGNAAYKDLVRLKSELFSLKLEFDQLKTQIAVLQGELRLMIHSQSNVFIQPQLNDATLQTLSGYSPQSLFDSAMIHRPDLKLLKTQIEYNSQNIQLQKSNAIPDVRLIAGYDRMGGYSPNYNSIGFSIPLPFFNRNQGNIKSAQIEWERSKIEELFGIENVRKEISENYFVAAQVETSLQNFSTDFEKDYKKLMDQVFIGFNNRSITLLEFLDFYNAFKQNTIQLNELRFKKFNSLEQLNYSTGSNLFNRSL